MQKVDLVHNLSRRGIEVKYNIGKEKSMKTCFGFEIDLKIFWV